ncbi:MAG: tetratricopeptide repeat protein [Caulobacter sp.]|nr:tetratricopeptide repeat protein [Caulobacter sp.]
MADASLETLLGEAAALRRAGRDREAEAAYERLLARHPDLPDSWYNLALLQRRAGRFDAALASYQQALDRRVSGPEEVHLNRGVIYADDLRRPDAAERELATALGLNPRYVPALLNLGNLHEDRGRKAAALEAYGRILALQPDHAEALARTAGLATVTGPDDPMIERLRRAIARPDLAPPDRASLAFALGRLLDVAGAHDQAFEAYRQANAFSRAAAPRRAGYDRAAQARLADSLIAAFPPPADPAPNRTARAGAPRPIFICGMFRSGSTLAEQVLASHPKVTSGGELDLLPAMVRRLSPWPAALSRLQDSDVSQMAEAYRQSLAALFPGADRITDKRPDNFLHVGLIKRLFPDARIVHTVRAPLDNALSVWFLHLDQSMAYALDLEDIGHYLAQERRLMAHWKSLWPDDILTFDYDAFVRDPRPLTARLLSFCGLDWDEACLAFHRTDSNVRTASVWQVREPLYQRSSGRWRHYAPQLEPLRQWFRDQGLADADPRP